MVSEAGGAGMSDSELLVFETVKRNIMAVLNVEGSAILPERALTELGANSLDRAEIVTLSMEDLGLRFPLRELQGVANIGSLVRLLAKKLSP
jgi:polyketide biosynthesis acyl carrier protein